MSLPEEFGELVRAFFDVRVFYPNARSNFKHPHLKSVLTVQENEKKRAYVERICEVEHGSFTPLVFSSTGSTGLEATTFYKQLASLLAKNYRELQQTDATDSMPSELCLASIIYTLHSWY